MRSRFPLLLKKRGRRRTDVVLWTRVAEIVYQTTFILAGAIGVWWCLTDVLLPERRLAQEVDAFRQEAATIVGLRVERRPGLAEDEFCPELQLRFEGPEGAPVVAWTRHGVGRDTPSRVEAEQALTRFAEGQTVSCWYDPGDPERVVLSRGSRWWPWFVLVIPVSLMSAGVFGLSRALARVKASAERRASQSPSPRTVSAAEPIEDSPGVKLAYRLPMDGGEGWRLTGMAVLAVLWNLLAAVVVFQAIGFESIPGRLGITVLAIAPLAATGFWLVRSFWRDATSIGGFGATRVEIAGHPLQLGGRHDAVVLQSGAGRLRLLCVDLVCEEIATFQQGTDSRVVTLEASRTSLVRERGAFVEPTTPLELGFVVEIPEEGPLSFRSPHNEVRWSIEVRVSPARLPEATRRFPLCVTAPPTAIAAEPTAKLADSQAVLVGATAE